MTKNTVFLKKKSNIKDHEKTEKNNAIDINTQEPIHIHFVKYEVFPLNWKNAQEEPITTWVIQIRNSN